MTRASSSDDADSVTTSIDDLDIDAGRVERMRSLGPARIRERYTWEHVVDEYDRVLRAAVTA